MSTMGRECALHRARNARTWAQNPFKFTSDVCSPRLESREIGVSHDRRPQPPGASAHSVSHRVWLARALGSCDTGTCLGIYQLFVSSSNPRVKSCMKTLNRDRKMFSTYENKPTRRFFGLGVSATVRESARHVAKGCVE